MNIHIPNNDKNIRTLSTYTWTLGIKSKSSQKLFQCTINNIKRFGKINTRDMSRYNEDNIYDLLQEWIIWNTKRGITASSMMCYFNTFRSYLWYNKIKLDSRNIRQNLTFPQMLHADQIPITHDVIKQILDASKQEFKFQLLALVSSGMRASELGQIKLAHLDFTHSNVMVRLSAQLTKTGRSRITFFSRQVSDMIRYRIKNNESNFTFCGNRTTEQALNLILKRFASARRRINLLEKYEHCKQNRYIFHIHSMRSYFITKANRVQFGLGHILAGHEFYMKGYNRYTVDELLCMYKQFENNVTFPATPHIKM